MRRCYDRFPAHRGVEKPAAVILDRQSREDSAFVGARVDADAIAPLLHFGADRMAVDHDEAVLTVVEQERLPDPAQVGLLLPVERNSGANAGVDEQEIAELAAVDEASKEFDMLIRYRRPDP